jgi:hypothetical protein
MAADQPRARQQLLDPDTLAEQECDTAMDTAIPPMVTRQRACKKIEMRPTQ